MGKKQQRTSLFGFSIRNRKGQMWVSDFVIGLFIFMIGVVLVTRIIISNVSNDEFPQLKSEAETLSDYFLHEGVPHDWSNETVVRIGLTTNHRLNDTKLQQLYNMSYDKTKFYLSTNKDYLLFFKYNNTLMNLSRCSYGAINFSTCEVNVSSLEYDNLIRISRLLPYNGSIIEMEVYLWT
ncbi:hypothetical protein H8D36_01845 [archaeon]|nr:hypothetical protein [archaeon]MBL7057421.1 hypothetical protein [Candidatus Woesearchaeota archaeon]